MIDIICNILLFFVFILTMYFFILVKRGLKYEEVDRDLDSLFTDFRTHFVRITQRELTEDEIEKYKKIIKNAYDNGYFSGVDRVTSFLLLEQLDLRNKREGE